MASTKVKRSGSDVTDTKRSKSSKKIEKVEEIEEVEPEAYEEVVEEMELGSDESDFEEGSQECTEVHAVGEENGENPKNAWMTPEQREEKKKAQKAEQKRLLKERRMSKPGYELINDNRRDWDLARRLDTPKEQRHEAVQRLFSAFTGKFRDIILKHEGSRIVQTCVKHGSPEQRRQIATELKGAFLEVARNKYGKHIVTKLLLYCPEQRDCIISEFYGHIVKGMKHKEVAHVIEAIFVDYANASKRQRIIQEFYGPEYALFHKEPIPLSDILSSNPEKKTSSAKSLEEALSVLLNKGSLGTTIVHRLILEYMDCVDIGTAQNWIGGVSEFLPEIVHTLDGAKAVSRCIAMATAKDRKAIIKSFKPFVEKICKDDRGFQTMLCIFSLVDDTVLVGKSLIGELKGCIESLLKDKHGRKVLGYLACGVNPRILPCQTIQLLKDVRELAKITSKKEDAIRWQELRSQILPDIIPIFTANAVNILKDMESAIFASEVIGSFDESEQLESFKQIIQELGEDAFLPGPKCEFVKKCCKSCKESVGAHLLGLITVDLAKLAQGEGAFMLMHMLKHESLAPKVKKLEGKLKKIEGSQSVAHLLTKISVLKQ